MGNTVLVIGITLVIFILHVLIASTVEGYWLAKDAARHRLRKQHVSNSNLQSVADISGPQVT